MTTPAVVLSAQDLMRGGATDEDRVDQPNAAVQAQASALKILRDVCKGTLWLRDEARSEDYLPKAPGEKSQNYRARLTRTPLFNMTQRTVEGLAGLIFRKDPELDEVPDAIAAHLENVDLAGSHLDVFARRFGEDVLTAGHAGVLVDAPDTGGRRLSKAEEAKAGMRPYWVHIKKDDIVSFRTSIENGVTVLDQLVLRDLSTEPAGQFVDRVVMRYRVFDRNAGKPTWQVWRASSDRTAAPVLEREGPIANQTEIPVAWAYGPRKYGYLETVPPLLDLAELNITHFQVLSDHLTNAHMASVPVLVRIGMEMTNGDEQGAVTIGPNCLMDVPMQGDAKYISAPADALTGTKAILDDLKADGATLGLSMLAQDKRQAETAQAKRIDKSQGDSALAAVARSLQDCFEQALTYHANYLKMDPGSAGEIVINRDFENLTLSAQEITAWSGLVAAGQLSLETLWSKLQEGNALPEDFDPEKEKEAVAAENEPPAPEPGTQPTMDEEDAAPKPRRVRYNVERDGTGAMTAVTREEN